MQLTVTLLKIIFARPRPELAVYAESSFAFPSGHSAASVAFFGFLTYGLIRERVGPIIVSFLLGATLVLLIGLSRIYLVEHYLSDVLNGYLVGALWALLGIWLVEWLHTKRDMSRQTENSPWQRVASIGVVVGALVVVGFIVKDYQQARNIPSLPIVIQLDRPLEAAFTVGLLPTQSESILGQYQEPISLIVLAENEADFLEAFRKSGWLLGDRPSISTLTRAAIAVWFDREYTTAPLTPSFWNGQPHDFGFQIETADKSLRERHHARFWSTGFRSADGQFIFVGTASFDDGLKWGLTHHINPNIDAERNFLASDLRDTGLVKTERSIQLVAPVLGQNLTGDPFFTDGKVIVFQLESDSGTTNGKPEPEVHSE
jgi:undecaprenyl-diphosphatase